MEKLKPILRPLSDMFKFIEHNGEEIVPFFKINMCPIEYHHWCFSKFDYKVISTKNYNQLTEYGFDLHGLIKKGEAIDINTIK